jgi:hypothetical protein
MLSRSAYEMPFSTGGLFLQKSLKLVANYQAGGKWVLLRNQALSDNLLQTRTQSRQYPCPPHRDRPRIENLPRWRPRYLPPYEMNEAFLFANQLEQYRPCKVIEVTFIRSKAPS